MHKKSLSIFTLAMINLAAIGSVKNWPLIAESGFSAIFYFLLATVVFFIPIALVSAELATGWPKTGGVFVWVKEAFGHRLGFLAIWLLWIENVIWYPTTLSFVAVTGAYIIDPSLAHHPVYVTVISLIAFWGLTLINMRGMKISGWISTVGVILGSLIPAVVIIALGSLWFFSGNPLQLTFSLETFFPNLFSLNEWVIFTGVLLSLAGMEMSAIHVRDMQNPQSGYPKATLITVLLIMTLSILGVLSIGIVIPQHAMSLAGGSIQAFTLFVKNYGLESFTPLMALLMFIGALASLSTWIVGPSRGLLAAASHGDLPPWLRHQNAQGMPSHLLLLQALIVTALSLIFIFMPSINSAYWILTVMVTQVYLVMYLLMFAAAIALRYKKPDVKRAYQIPGGKLGIWVVAGLGILSSFLTFLIGFLPNEKIFTGSSFYYVLTLIVGIILFCLAPSLIYRFKKPSWNHHLPHEEGEEI
ncbi:amino acid permease [Rhabdochlamydiaceae symbiont of Dictyostelium giganteum]|uniref:amino acid permease n=1 Tax=Rhabdochlamydiaceae symbiont of Dictyostelium giganteum TaxID=3342349 RepID=UPI00384CA68F